MKEIFSAPWTIVLFSLLFGYLAGSLSFARIITVLKTRSKKIAPISQPIPGTNRIFESDSISATVISQNLGKHFGCLTSLLDMIKVGLPTFLVMYWFPEEPYFLAAALMGVLGHIFPVYHGFKGGRGESPMIGAMLIINWYGIFIANAAAMVLGYLSGSVLVLRYGWYVLMIGWYWILFHDIRYIGFMLGANILFWYSMSKDLAKYADLKQEKGLEIKEEDVSDFILMGRGLGRFFDSYSGRSLLKKLLKKN
ncbi:MAG: glycerol-3-phosphate acyltransferase [Bacteroides sp.]|jgi:glycerol-3-phosphate acyltransferase PlsY|nr:glycerol-3-phosphate acyltransferase [Bacteroides sp.]